jgi:hypothetical protein
VISSAFKDRDINDNVIHRPLESVLPSPVIQWTFNSPIDELVMIENVKECETWDDVLRVTGEVWDYSKEEQQQIRIA